MTDRSKTVVMLIDWDNLQICHSRDAPGTELDLQALIALAQSYGTLVSARAYAEWNLLTERLAVYKAGIEPVFAPVMRPENSPREGKSLADTVMVADGVDLLWTVAPDVFVLATSDKDMIPLARIAKQRGAAVVVLGSDLTAIPLVEMSNVFITYRQLLRELDRVGELEAPVGRAPARERRLRESRRPSSEPYSGGLGGPGGALSAPGNFGGGSNFSGASNFGAGGRSTGRNTGNLPAPVGPSLGAPLPAPPQRRIQPPMAPAEIVSAMATPPAPIAAPAPVSEPEDHAEGGLLGLGEPGARRRRRRGGRGRRVGIGAAGENETQTGTALDGDDEDGAEVEAVAEVRPATVAANASPDDIDDAVLKLLASRDRDATPVVSVPVAPAPVPTAAPEAPEEQPAVPPFGSPALADLPAELPPPAPRKRIARTSFGSFGPPESSRRVAAASPVAGPATVTASIDPPAEPAAESSAAASSASDPVAASSSISSPSTELPPPGLADAVSPAAEVSAAAADEIAAAEASTAARPSRSSRSSAGRRPRRTPASGATASTKPATEPAPAASADGDAAAPRRRRTRRAVREAAEGESVSSEAAPSTAPASEAPASDPVTSEAGA